MDATVYDYNRFRALLRRCKNPVVIDTTKIIWTKMWLKHTWGKFKWWKPNTVYLNIEFKGQYKTIVSTLAHELDHRDFLKENGLAKYLWYCTFNRDVMEKRAEGVEQYVEEALGLPVNEA